MGILLSDYFTRDKFYAMTHCDATFMDASAPLGRQQTHHSWHAQNHPLGSVNELGVDEETKKEYFNNDDNLAGTPSVKSALRLCDQLAREVFEHPRIVMARSVHDVDMVLEECISQSHSAFVTAVQRRLGRSKAAEEQSVSSSSDDDDSGSDGDHDGEEDEERTSSWFSPKNIFTESGDKIGCGPNNHHIYSNSRHWTILANLCSTVASSNRQMFQITALPVGGVGKRITTSDHLDYTGDDDEFSDGEYS